MTKCEVINYYCWWYNSNNQLGNIKADLGAIAAPKKSGILNWELRVNKKVQLTEIFSFSSHCSQEQSLQQSNRNDSEHEKYEEHKIWDVPHGHS